MVKLDTTFMGLKLKNPIVVASSGLTNSISRITEFERYGVGAVVLKSIFEEQILGEAESMMSGDIYSQTYPEAEDYIKNYTRQNTLDNYINLIKGAKSHVDIPVIASVNCVSKSEWISFAKKLEEAGADGIEMNIFMLPVERDVDSNSIEQRYLDIVKSVVAEVEIPIAVKIGANFTNVTNMIDKLYAYGAKGVTMFNRFYEPDIDLDTLTIGSSEVFSAKTDLRRTLRWLGIVSAAVPNVDLAASTGIHNGDNFIKVLLAGATVGQLCSTLYINGPEKVVEIKEELVKFMEKWNFASIEEVQGKLNYSAIPDSGLYERAQFMKYFSNKHTIW